MIFETELKQKISKLQRAVEQLAAVGLGATTDYRRGQQTIRKALKKSRTVFQLDHEEDEENDDMINDKNNDDKDDDRFEIENSLNLEKDLNRLDCIALVHVPSASAARDVQWGTWTSVIGWPVKGFWHRDNGSTSSTSTQCDNSLIEGSDLYPGRVPITVGGSGGGGEVTVLCCDRPHSYKMIPVLACGNDRGAVRLFNYPCYDSRAAFKQYHAHTSQVTKVRFMNAEGRPDDFLLSMGRSEQVFCLWNTDCVDEARERAAAGTSIRDTQPSFRNSHGIVQQNNRSGGGGGEGGGGGGSHSEFAEKGRRSNKRGLLAWLSEAKEPSNLKTENLNRNTLPQQRLTLKHVYGYGKNSENGHSNCFISGNGRKICYYSGTIGIVSDRNKLRRQVCNLDHKGKEITCIAVHQSSHLVATADMGRPIVASDSSENNNGAASPNTKCCIIIWDDNSGSTLKVISDFHTNGISRLCFSANGALLFSIGMDEDHSVAVHSVISGSLIGCAKGDRRPIRDLAVEGNVNLVTVGIGFVKYYSLPSGGGELESKKGIFSKHCSTNNVLCVAFAPNSNDAVTGQDDGSLYLWKGRTCTLIRTGIHTASVRSITKVTNNANINTTSSSSGGGGGSSSSSGGGDGVISGGDDGLVIIW
eukprot:CAMPEP_0114370960 /NCGR_PEP_ID=MMETSP0101-20121206/32942_1 /TAXON_ID=38822 ORGANISM="Pteridomonas danica, Strain PT" /NCGR_SAMPLE_ID=MMETSP0101 /ASSEMBLY_ACC=CAM_ASM_000211 /LENGTH=643 /DNA_ID=CAMNT_0001522831 /DNA_START=1165 /DNA_END=3094 /DNA_ORIENTATION=+